MFDEKVGKYVQDFFIEDDGEGIIIKFQGQKMHLKEEQIFDLHLAIMELEKKRNYQKINAPDLYNVQSHNDYCYGFMGGKVAIAKKSNHQIVGYVQMVEDIPEFIDKLKSLANLIDRK